MQVGDVARIQVLRRAGLDGLLAELLPENRRHEHDVRRETGQLGGTRGEVLAEDLVDVDDGEPGIHGFGDHIHDRGAIDGLDDHAVVVPRGDDVLDERGLRGRIEVSIEDRDLGIVGLSDLLRRRQHRLVVRVRHRERDVCDLQRLVGGRRGLARARCVGGPRRARGEGQCGDGDPRAGENPPSPWDSCTEWHDFSCEIGTRWAAARPSCESRPGQCSVLAYTLPCCHT